MRFLDAGEHAGGIGIVEDLDLVGGDRRGRLDVEIAGQQAAQQLDDRPRAAVVALRVQRDPAGQGRRRAPVEVLHGVFQPQEARIGPGMAEDEVAPLLGDVLTFIDDDRVEQEGSAQRQFGGALLQALEGVGQGEVRCLAGMAHALVTELVVGAGQPAARGDAVEMIGQRAVEADIERPLAGFERGAVLGQGQLGLSRTGGAGDAQAERLELKTPAQCARPPETRVTILRAWPIRALTSVSSWIRSRRKAWIFAVAGVSSRAGSRRWMIWQSWSRRAASTMRSGTRPAVSGFLTV